jgi:hypothetical protein
MMQETQSVTMLGKFSHLPPFSKDGKLQLCSDCGHYVRRTINVCPFCHPRTCPAIFELCDGEAIGIVRVYCSQECREKDDKVYREDVSSPTDVQLCHGESPIPAQAHCWNCDKPLD